jgi:hypothetical protein
MVTFSDADFDVSTAPAFPMVFTNLKTCSVIDWKAKKEKEAMNALITGDQGLPSLSGPCLLTWRNGQ